MSYIQLDEFMDLMPNASSAVFLRMQPYAMQLVPF